MVLLTQFKSMTPAHIGFLPLGRTMCRAGITLFLGLFLMQTAGVMAQSLVRNGNFEGGHTNVWQHNKWGNVGLELTTYSTEEMPEHVAAGTKTFKAEVGSLGTDKSSFNSISNRFTLKPNTTYHYSYQAKAEDSAAVLEFYVSSLTDGVILFETEFLTEDFVEYSGQFTTPANLAELYYVVFYYPEITTYWLDEVSLYEEKPIDALAGTPGNQTVNLSWPPAVGATSVKLFSKAANGTFGEVLTGQLDANSSSAFFNNLVNGTEYTFFLDIEGGPFDGKSSEFSVRPSAAWNNSIISNPSFENAGTLSDWSTNIYDASAIANFSQDAAAAQGSKSMKVDIEQTSPLGSYVINASPESFDLIPGLTYTLTFWAKASFAGARLEAWIKSLDVKGENDSDIFLTFDSYELSSEWKEFRIPFTSGSIGGEFLAGLHFANKGVYHLDNFRVLGPVSDLAGIPQNGGARLRWSPALGAEQVKLFRKEGNGTFTEVLPGTLTENSSEVEVPGLNNGSAYSFYLEVIGGPYAGTSQEISLVPSATSDESLIINGGFEREMVEGDEDGFETWQSNIWEGAATITADSTGPASGARALKVAVTSLPPNGNFFSINSNTNTFQLLPDVEYRFAFWAKANLPGARLVAQVARFRETANVPVNVLFSNEDLLTTEWQLYEQTFTTPDTVKAGQQFYAVLNFGSTLAEFQVDNVTLEGPVSSLEAIPGDQRVTVRWRPASGSAGVSLRQGEAGGALEEIFPGQVNSGTRYMIAKGLENGVSYRYQLDVTGGPFEGSSNVVSAIPGPNLVLNNGFEFNLLNWEPILDTRFGPDATIFEVAGGVFEGNRAMQAQVNVLGSNFRAINVSSNLFKIYEGRSYTLSFWARGDKAGNRIAVFLESEDFQEGLAFGTYDLTEEWELYHYNFTPESITDSMFRVFMHFESTGTFWLDEFYVGTAEEEAFCEGGTIAMPNGLTDRTVCGEAGQAELVRFDSLNAESDNFLYLVTDTSNIIIERLSQDFKEYTESSPAMSRIYGLAYSGDLNAEVGEYIGAITATGCVDLTTNYISIVQRTPQAGAVQLMLNEAAVEDSVLSFCVTSQDGSSLNAIVNNTASEESDFTYLVTDVSNLILKVSANDTVDFESDFPNEVRVWGLSYTGDLRASVGAQADIDTLSTTCFELSSNYITLMRDSVEGGSLGTSLASSTVFACRQDTAANVQLFTTSETDQYTYVITDTSNTIIRTDTTAFLNFADLGVGATRVWGLAYTGGLTTNVGRRCDSGFPGRWLLRVVGKLYYGNPRFSGYRFYFPGPAIGGRLYGQ